MFHKSQLSKPERFHVDQTMLPTLCNFYFLDFIKTPLTPLYSFICSLKCSVTFIQIQVEFCSHWTLQLDLTCLSLTSAYISEIPISRLRPMSINSEYLALGFRTFKKKHPMWLESQARVANGCSSVTNRQNKLPVSSLKETKFPVCQPVPCL